MSDHPSTSTTEPARKQVRNAALPYRTAREERGDTSPFCENPMLNALLEEFVTRERAEFSNSVLKGRK